MVSFRCADVGMNCGFLVEGATSTEEVLKITAVHAWATHGIYRISSELAAKVSAAIRN